ncbi:MAG: enoyl-CoA hydratase/isomerase family protein [Chloroflexi bacterium]|nr:enoyl-CoA hydratase/isomerase family protein [Chloroflexota bacterium]
MAYETILYELQDRILRITLNRPERLNAMTETMRYELIDAFTRAGDDASVRVVVLTGAGRGFCSGADLAAAVESGQPVDFGHVLRNTYNPLIMRMRCLPKPIIAAVNGVAAGAGMSVALACDLRIAADSASFLQAFVKIGLVPDSGSTWLLPRLVGLTRAMDLMLSGRKVSAPEALAMGLVNQVVPDGEFADVVDKLAREYAGAPTRAIGYIKQAVEFGLDHSLEAALDKEAELQELAGKTADHQEGVSAFLQKRSPQFRGE